MKKHFPLIFWLCLFACLGTPVPKVFSQTSTSATNSVPGQIKGKVTSGTDEPISGVTVLLKGTTIGASTASDGTFTLPSSKKSGTLVFSFVGYTTQEVSFNGSSNIDVILTDEAKALKDVVVVGYGTQRKRDVTGSVASIKASEIQNIPIPSVEGLIQGRAAGVQVNPNSGVPGAGISVRIRGAACISGGN
jgi:hypothetical protein